MPAKSYSNLKKILLVLMFLALPSQGLFAKNNLTEESAKIYRDKGFEAQSVGNLDAAMAFYQKTVELDPSFAAAYNDLGVIYEIKGFKDRAEDSYLQCIKINPYYENAYFNLATLYEESGDLRKAAQYWRKRIQFGSPNDPGTQKAKQHLNNIGMLVEDIGIQLKEEQKQEEIRNRYIEYERLKGLSSEKEAQREKAKKFFLNAKEKYAQGDYAAALKYAATAQFFDPTDSDLVKFIEKAREKVISANVR